ncbi:hypothetical protein FF1_031768 [Malus domestica]
MWFPINIVQKSADACSFPCMYVLQNLNFFFSNGSVETFFRADNRTAWSSNSTHKTPHFPYFGLARPPVHALVPGATYAVRTEEFLHLRRLGQVRLNPFLGAPIWSTNPRSVFSFIFFFQDKERKKKTSPK